MSTAAALRIQIESSLANRIPSALTPMPRTIRPVLPTGIEAVDELLDGGLPLGAITEIAGAECSGRTALALSFVARVTQQARVCAWIDTSNALDPESAAAAGMDLTRLLWVRCGRLGASGQHRVARNQVALPEKYLAPPPIVKGRHGGGFGPHPRNETKGLPDAVGDLLHPESIAPRCAEPQHNMRPLTTVFEPPSSRPSETARNAPAGGKPWGRLEQALRVTDLLLQNGGFSAIVLDMGSIAPEHVLRIPQATWFRYRAATERTQACILLLTQHVCSKSSAGLVLSLQPGDALRDLPTVFTGVRHRVEIVRQRFTNEPSNVIPLRKPVQRELGASWQSRTAWVCR